VRVRPEIVAGLEIDISGLRRPVAAGDDQSDAVELPHEGQVCKRVQVAERRIGKWSPRPGRSNDVGPAWTHAVRGRVVQLEREWDRVRRDLVESRGVTPSKIRP